MKENVLIGIKNRLPQRLAYWAPTTAGFRATLHRLRGVGIGEEVWIGCDVLIETAHPSLVSIGNRVTIIMRTTIVAHFLEVTGVTIKDDAFIGACALILPGVTIGEGAVVAAGSVVTASVPPTTVVQGNPARWVAKCGIPLGARTSMREFRGHLKTLGADKRQAGEQEKE